MKLLEYVQEMYDLSNAQGVLSWDQDTYMPPRGAESRARTLALLERESHRRMTNPKLGELAREALESEDPVTKEAGQYWLDTYEESVCVPESLASELTEATSISTAAWHEATTFEEMIPHLERVVHLNRQFAACYPDYKTYDCLLDCFEPGMTTEILDTAFSVLKPGLIELRGQVKATKAKDVSSSKLQLLDLSKKITAWMGYDYSRGNLSETEHPFMVGFGSNDVRIAAALKPHDPLWTLGAAIHEAGHGIYEQNAGFTEYFSLDSMALHESQSLFWEMMVGRSKDFWNIWFDEFNASVGCRYASPEEVIRDLMNHDPSNVIRLQAGDLDYGLHIMLRYELERNLFEKGMEARDMKDCFNELCMTSFGRVPTEDRREGVLQDTHWPSGLFGYFPCYLIGASFAAQLWQASPRTSDPVVILDFLKQNVHQHGGRLGFNDVADRMGGYNPKPYLDRLVSYYL